LLSSRFFRRIFLPYLVLVAIATGSIGMYAMVRVRDRYLARQSVRLHDEAVLIGDLLKPGLIAGQTTAVDTQTHQIGGALHAHIIVITDDGKFIGEGEADSSIVDNPRQHGEVLAADRVGDGLEIRRSQKLNVDQVYYAHKVQTDDGKTYFVRLAVPLTERDDQLFVLYAVLGGVLLAAALLAAALSSFFAARNSDPILKVTEFATALSRGELNRRVLLTGGGDIAQLSRALNTMADSLGELIAGNIKGRIELLAMLTSMSEGVIATNTRQNIVVVNQRAGELLAFDARAVQGKPLWEAVRNEAILKAAGEVLASHERKAFQVSPAAGQYLDVTVSTYPARGPAEGMILVAHDTTQSMRYQELRKEFVANVSHELRTPLTVIKGFTETLRDGAMIDPVMGPKFLATIERHVDQLTNLVSDLLELSKLEGSPELPKRLLFDMGAVLRRALELLLPAAQKKMQAVIVELPPNLPRVIGNPDYIERALSNLVENAIKYTPEHGKILVSAMVDGDFLQFEVADNGIGIPAEDLSRVFERFYRIDRSRSREMGGTGLGLSIVKHVVQVHGGTIDVSSTPGQGSKFRMRLPIASESVA
jgi:two-component system phosphate regulon sensor histidine kinase PhoR